MADEKPNLTRLSVRGAIYAGILSALQRSGRPTGETMRFCLPVLAIMALLSGPVLSAQAAPSPGTTASPSQEAAARARIQSAAVKWRNGDSTGVVQILEPLVADPSFSLLDTSEQYAVHQLLGIGYLTTGNATKAFVELKAASSSPWSAGADWLLLVQAASGAGDKIEVVRALAKIARDWRESLSNIPDRYLLRTALDSKDVPRADRFVLLEALFNAGWSPKDKSLSADDLWMELSAMLSENGQPAEAADASKGITEPSVLMLMRLDKRFDSIVAKDPERFDPDALAAARIKNYRDAANASPEKLKPLVTLSEALTEMGRYQEALGLCNEALGRLTKDPKAYTDANSETNWLLNVRADALFGLGHLDEALALMQNAARQPEDGAMMNVSQAINLADFYDRLGRPKEALVAVSGLNSESKAASPYGIMEFMNARSCAYAQLGDHAKLAQSLDYLQVHAKDGVPPYLDALICAGDMDAAASAIVQLVNDPDTRLAVLAKIQPGVNAGTTAVNRRITGRWTALRERNDVRIAVDKVGYILKKPLPYLPQ